MLCPALKSGRLRMPHAVLLHCCPQNRCSRRRSGGGAQPGRDVLLGGSGAGNRPCNSLKQHMAWRVRMLAYARLGCLLAAH